MNCPTCGKEYEDSVTYCGICGTYLQNGNVDSFSQAPRNNPTWAIRAGFRNYFNFNARATRSEYWWWILFFWIWVSFIFVGYSVVDSLGTVLLFGFLGILIPTLSITIRRLHDSGRSGWWLLIFFVPFGRIVLLVFLCLGSNYGSNRFGQNPRSTIK